jgi:low affinity Fe/Cu permease
VQFASEISRHGLELGVFTLRNSVSIFLMKKVLDRVHPVKHFKKSAQKPLKHRGGFHKFARQSARFTGKPFSFGLAALIILVWMVTGPIFHFSDTWQLVINTGTTIVTFLMVFLIQNTQNRDSEAVQLKLDELIRATETAHTVMLDVEELSEEELDHLKRCYHKIAVAALKEMRAGKTDLGIPDIEREIRLANKA